ncbi:SpoIIE family protein phosphatase [Bacillus piscicola]|uniref:SpoIIE family protein phosphatase n=1 Tax=Bacillus piscicola TaxID=1632684 RepID=UPI001F099BFC|nr:SpoIIE family protein phosphatase [Bacillus piscicola]
MMKEATNLSVEVATFQQRKKGNACCGDAYRIIETDRYFLCALADGLGSGDGAHRSAEKAMQAVEEYQKEEVDAILKACNQALHGERGVVITVLKVDLAKRELVYGNVGNISTYFFTSDHTMQRPLPSAGYLSGRKINYRIEILPLPDNFSFVLHSDGIRLSHSEQQVMKRLFSLEATVKYFEKKAHQQNDDVTVIAGFLP